MNNLSDDPRYIAPAFAYPQATGGPSSHAVNEQSDHHPSTTNTSAEQSPYHAGHSGTSSSMANYGTRHLALMSPSHGHPNLIEPYSPPLDDDGWLHNDMHQPFTGEASQPVISDRSHHSSQTGMPSWDNRYQFDNDRREQPTSSSFHPAQPPPDQHWSIESGIFDPAAHSAPVRPSQWGYPPTTPIPQPYSQPIISYPGPRPPTAQNVGSYIGDLVPHRPDGTPSLPTHTLSNSSMPHQRTNVFSSFPADDRLRTLNYHQSSDHGQQTNDQLLGVGAVSSHSEAGPSHPHYPLMIDTLTPLQSTSNVGSTTQVAWADVGNRSDDETDQKKYKAYFPDDPKLQKLALSLSKEDWVRLDQAEPPPNGEGQPLGASASRFEAFFEANGKHRCYFFENGKRCTHTAPRKERALGHVRQHFDYKPFYCEGNCGKTNCIHKYHCKSALNDHIRRRGNPERECEVCGRQISAQNIRRHRNTHAPRAQSELPTSPSQNGPPKRSKFKRVVNSIGRAIKRTLSRSPSP